MINKPKETEVQSSIMDFLLMKKIYCWRNQSGVVYDHITGNYRRLSKYQLKGVSDILGILPSGQFFAIEVKRDKSSKPSDDQVEFIRNIIKNNGIAFVAHSIDDVQEHLLMK